MVLQVCLRRIMAGVLENNLVNESMSVGMLLNNTYDLRHPGARGQIW
jgi:hypothetical protein